MGRLGDPRRGRHRSFGCTIRRYLAAKVREGSGRGSAPVSRSIGPISRRSGGKFYSFASVGASG
jgi:hypothetical protein